MCLFEFFCSFVFALSETEFEYFLNPPCSQGLCEVRSPDSLVLLAPLSCRLWGVFLPSLLCHCLLNFFETESLLRAAFLAASSAERLLTSLLPCWEDRHLWPCQLGLWVLRLESKVLRLVLPVLRPTGRLPAQSLLLFGNSIQFCSFLPNIILTVYYVLHFGI